MRHRLPEDRAVVHRRDPIVPTCLVEGPCPLPGPGSQGPPRRWWAPDVHPRSSTSARRCSKGNCAVAVVCASKGAIRVAISPIGPYRWRYRHGTRPSPTAPEGFSGERHECQACGAVLISCALRRALPRFVRSCWARPAAGGCPNAVAPEAHGDGKVECGSPPQAPLRHACVRRPAAPSSNPGVSSSGARSAPERAVAKRWEGYWSRWPPDLGSCAICRSGGGTSRAQHTPVVGLFGAPVPQNLRPDVPDRGAYLVG